MNLPPHSTSLEDLARRGGPAQAECQSETLRHFDKNSPIPRKLLGAQVAGQQQGSLEMRLAQYAKPKLLIIDEQGYPPLEPQAGHVFFQLISRDDEQGSVQISSNRPVEEWDEMYSFAEGFASGDQVVVAAILDRLMHHSPRAMTIRGDS
jgi:DNA replication protein DnaC